MFTDLLKNPSIRCILQKKTSMTPALWSTASPYDWLRHAWRRGVKRRQFFIYSNMHVILYLLVLFLNISINKGRHERYTILKMLPNNIIQ